MTDSAGARSTALGFTRERWLFTLALLLTTWIPMGFFCVVGSVEKPGGGLEIAKAALLFIGGFHVAATLVLYVDKTFLPLVRQDPVRYVHVPLVAIIGS